VEWGAVLAVAARLGVARRAAPDVVARRVALAARGRSPFSNMVTKASAISAPVID
jgi:hypothetical protein